MDARALGEVGAEIFQERIRLLLDELDNDLLQRLRHEPGWATAMRRGLHRARLPDQAQEAGNGGSSDRKAVGELLQREALPRAGLNDPNPEIIRDWGWHAPGISTRVWRASNLNRAADPLDPVPRLDSSGTCCQLLNRDQAPGRSLSETLPPRQ